MEFSKQDLAYINNISKALSKATHTLDGMEVLAMADAFAWLGKLHKTASLEIQQTEQAIALAKAKEEAAKRAPLIPQEPKNKIEIAAKMETASKAVSKKGKV